MAVMQATNVRQEIYGSDTVRAALRELFFNKCAYCESLLVGGELDVDHYRPKAGVAGIPDHCGYYWLAYVWDNLLASCIFCNRLRKEPATWQSRTRGETAGKGNQFPIADERKRAWSPSDDVSLEDAMIVNPTTDEPAEHIGFDPLGHAIPLTKKGEASIEIFGLNARSLYTQRAALIDDVSCLLQEKAEVEVDPAAVDRSRRIGRINRRICRRIDASRPYVAAGHAVLSDPAAFGMIPPTVGG